MRSFHLRNYVEKYSGQHLPRRIVAMLLAVTVMGLGVSLFMLAAMGCDPYSTLNQGVALKLGLSFGTWQAAFNVLLLIVILFLDRSMLGLGTLGNMFVIGFSADLFGSIWNTAFPGAADAGFFPRLLLTLLGVSLMLLGCSFYVTSDLGMSPYDALSFIVPNRTKIPFRWWRILCDVTCVTVGFFCGAPVGIGTLIMAFGTGPLLPLCNKYIAAPVLKTPQMQASTQ